MQIAPQGDVDAATELHGPSGLCLSGSPVGARCGKASNALHRDTLHKDRPPYSPVRAVQPVSEGLQMPCRQRVTDQRHSGLNRCLKGTLGLRPGAG